MSVVYFDACVFVKLVLVEEGSDEAVELWNVAEVAIASRLAYPEVCAAIAGAHRNHELDDRAQAQAMRQLDGYWVGVRPIELTAAVAHRAGELARRRALRGADAVHLASALSIEIPRPTLATWDHRLRDAALAEGLAVAPAPPRH